MVEKESGFEKIFNSFREFLKIPVITSDEALNEQSKSASPPILIDEEAIKSEIKGIISNESGWDRIKEYFSYNETIGQRSQFFDDNYEIITSTGILGFMLGSVIKINETKDNFKNNTQLAIYTSKKAANRAFVDYVYLQMLKGGARISFRFMLFSGIIITTASMIEAYRYKSNPLDYTVGGIVSGGILRMHFGLYGLLSGSLVGGAFGTIFGIARYTQLKLEGHTYEDLRNEYLRNKIIRREVLVSSIKIAKSDENSSIKTSPK